MFVIKKMRLNKFEPKPIVSNRSLFVAKGDCSAVVDSKATSDCINDPKIDGASKVKTISLAEQINRKAYDNHTKGQQEELKKNQREL